MPDFENFRFLKPILVFLEIRNCFTSTDYSFWICRKVGLNEYLCIPQKNFLYRVILSTFFNFISEYMGCYAINEENRVFISSAGDYSLDNISPLHCLRQCGKKYRFATLQEGKICLCANSLPATAVNDSECDIPCPGSDSWPSEARAWLGWEENWFFLVI